MKFDTKLKAKILNFDNHLYHSNNLQNFIKQDCSKGKQNTQSYS